MTKAKAITTDIAENTNTQRVLFRILISSLGILFLVYVYLIGSITFNVLARKALENTVRTLSDNVSQLELSYLNNSNQIDKSYALAKGFVDVDHNIFATRTTTRVAIR